MSSSKAHQASRLLTLPHLSQAALMIFAVSLAFLLLPARTAFPGQVTLSWDPPTTNVDGTPLTDLASYKVYYGTASRSYTQSADAGSVTTYTVSNLTDGATYYFAVTARDTGGNESSYSNEVSKTLQSASQFTLTVLKSGTGTGTVTATGINCGTDCTEPYIQGTVVTLTASPAAGSVFSGWTGGSCGSTAMCSTTLNANTTLTAAFTLNATYTITATAGTGGSISPSGAVSVASGAGQAFTITPSTGYRIAGVAVDGVSVGAVGTYTFSNVTANHTIAATFSANAVNGACGSSNAGTFTSAPTVNLCSAGTASAVTGTGPWAWSCAGANGGTTASCSANIQKWTVTASAGAGGTISPVGSVSVNHGAGQAFTITPSAGYSIAGVTVDGVSVGAVGTYTFSNVTANHTIAATFSANAVNGACGSSNGGTFASAPTANLCSAGTASAVTGTGPWAWSCAGASGGTTATCSANIQKWTVTASAGAGGTISPAGSVSVNHGAGYSFIISPLTGYSIASVSVDGVSVGAVGTYTFSNVTANHTIAATFSANAVNGACGSSNAGTFTSAPTVNLCSAGTASAVTGTGPWAWSCAGANGGTTASCSAALLPADSDGDGLTDVEESGPAGDNPLYDGNGDGVPDAQQNSVASLQTFGSTGYVTIVSAEGMPLRTVNAQQLPPGSPAGLNFPYSFIEFSIDNLAPGEATTLSILLPPDAVVNTYYKYGPTPENPAPHWYEFMYDGQTGAEIVGNTVILHFVDGLRGDDDLIANGFIIDQGGPASRVFTITSSAGSGGSISPSGSVAVPAGATQVFAITPAQGYKVKDVLIDGFSQGALTSVTLGNVAANHSVSVSFTPSIPPPNASVSPMSYTFSKVKVGWSLSSSFRLTNTGASSLSLTNVTVSGTNKEMFSVKFPGAKTLTPGSSYFIRVKFTPTSPGPKSAMLNIATNDPDTPVTGVPMTGTGI